MIDGSISLSIGTDQIESLILLAVSSLNFEPFLESTRIFLLLSVNSIFFCYIVVILFFPFDGILHSKMVSYQFEYAVQDEVGGYTIVMYFHTAMVNNKMQ